MFARTRSSLTAGGPTCLISIFSTTIPVCAASNGSQPDASIPSSSQPRHRNNFIQLTVSRHIFRADFGRAFKASVGSQKRQGHVAGGPVALLRDQQVHRRGFLFDSRWFGIVVAGGLVK